MDKAQYKIEKTIELYKELQNAEWDGSEVSGDVKLNQNIFDLINLLDQENLIYPSIIIDDKTVTLSELSLDKYLNKILKIKLQPPRNPAGEPYFAKDLDDLLSVKKFKTKEPSVYYLADKDYYNIKSEPDKSTIKYLSVIKLISIIQSISDHNEINGDKTKSIILTKGKLVIPINYTVNDLCKFKYIEEISIELRSPPHVENKVEIFKNTLYESLINVPTDERFYYLLKAFDSLYERYKDNLNLFMSEFSFDRVQEEISERKVEYIHKLNKVISDIQNKILAIPIALLLISTQMSQSEKDCLKNLVILIGSYVFVLLMYFLINNQLNTLETIKESIQFSKESYLRKYASFSDRFESVFENLFKRYKRQKAILNFIWYLTLFSFFVSLVLFMIFTKYLLF